MNEHANKGGSSRWMIYGANGYTGKLIAEEAARRGLRPVLAGRNSLALHELGARLDCEVRVIPLDEPEALVKGISDMVLVLHCAGPFYRTWEPMVRACLASGTHYLDINGEIPVLEALYKLDTEARENSITMLPGSGFDVVPTDCLAASLHKEMPDAVALRLAFAGAIHQSPGTWKATLEAIPRGGMLRRGGKLVHIPHADRIEKLEFDNGPEWCMSIPWGDLSSAWRSTGIPNIEVFGGTGRIAAYSMRAMGCISRIMKGRLLRASEGLVHALVRGPSEQQRSTGRYPLLGEVRNSGGNIRRKWMIPPEGYTTTVLTSLALVDAMLHDHVPPGVLTPSQAGGCELIQHIDGFQILDTPQPDAGNNTSAGSALTVP